MGEGWDIYIKVGKALIWVCESWVWSGGIELVIFLIIRPFIVDPCVILMFLDRKGKIPVP